jgi:hypothetical protein
MEIQFGKNPEITLSCCWNVHSWGGQIALPFTIDWWQGDCRIGYHYDISFWILGIRFGFEIWVWKK